jgi:hypothetical protein
LLRGRNRKPEKQGGKIYKEKEARDSYAEKVF